MQAPPLVTIGMDIPVSQLRIKKPSQAITDAFQNISIPRKIWLGALYLNMYLNKTSDLDASISALEFKTRMELYGLDASGFNIAMCINKKESYLYNFFMESYENHRLTVDQAVMIKNFWLEKN